MPQLRDPQLERTQPGVETALAIPVAIVEPIGATLVPAGADQAFDIGLHKDLQHGFRYSSEKSRSQLFCSSSTSAILSSVSGPRRFAVECRNATIAGLLDDYPSLTGFSTTTMDANGSTAVILIEELDSRSLADHGRGYAV